MTDDHGTVEQSAAEQSRARRFARPAALVAAGLLAGGIAAATVSASAQSTPTPAPSSTATPGDPDGSKSRGDETELTGTNAEKARAAALKAVPGGTIIRLETDSGPAEYEAHMRKADGTPVTVFLDANFAVTSVEEGRGGCGPGGRGDGQGSTPSAGPASA